MKQIFRRLPVIFLCLLILVMIFDAQVCFQGAQEGVSLCLTVVIPSLFPFLFLSSLLTGRLVGKSIPFFRKIADLCGVPEGAESLMLLGFLGGYPIGAGMIASAYQQGSISKHSAQRMLGFCNNAGPAFLFGMAGMLFDNHLVIWILWLIHMLSAMVVGFVLPGKRNERCALSSSSQPNAAQTLEKSLRAMANICGWVILFRILLTFLNRWVLWLLSKNINAGICGFFELTNGFAALRDVMSQGNRFILCSAMLAFGGLCVLMQTISVTNDLEIGTYFLGKVLQCVISVLIAGLLQPVLFPEEMQIKYTAICGIAAIIGVTLLTFWFINKKSSSISVADVV